MAKGGPCAIWAMKAGDYEAHVFEGTDAGLTAALAYVGSNGEVHVYPGSSTVTIPTIAAGVRLTKHEAGVESTYGPSTTEYDRTGRRKDLVYNVLDYDDVATAIAAVPAGGKLYFPHITGGYTPPTNAGWSITRAIEIYSDGPSPEGESFKFRADKDSVVFHIDSTAASVNDVIIRNASFSYSAWPPPTGGAAGVGAAVKLTGGNISSRIRLEDLWIGYSGGYGVYIKTGAPGNYTIGVTINRVAVYQSRNTGIYLEYVVNTNIDRVSATGCGKGGLYLTQCSTGSIANLEVGENGPDLTDASKEGQVVLKDTGDMVVEGCNIEEPARHSATWHTAASVNTVKNGLVIYNCRGINISGNEFDQGPSPDADISGSRGIYFYGDNSSVWNGAGNVGNVIGSNGFSEMEYSIEFNNTTYNMGNMVLPQSFFYTTSTTGKCQIKIPTGGNNFAFVQNQPGGKFDGTGVGILFPSMAHTSAVSSAVVQDGLVVYDSTNAQMRFRIGGAWYSAVVSAT